MEVTAAFLGVWTVWSATGWLVVSMRSGVVRKLLVTSMVLTACSLVFWLWDCSAWLRGLAVIPVLLLLGKAWMLGVRKTPWLDHPVKAGQFALWCLALPEGRLVSDGESRAALRRTAFLECFRILAKMMSLVVMLAINEHAEIHLHRPVQLVWTAVVFYLIFSMLRDVLSVAWATVGVEVSPMFNAPLIARNPRDFWGARWNLWFTRTVHVLVFEPVRLRSSAIWASAAVFGLSALVHEAIVVAGLATLDGRMILFFVSQGIGATAYTVLKKRGLSAWPRWLAVTTHFCWMWLTVALFLDPLDAFTGVSTWGLTDLIELVLSS